MKAATTTFLVILATIFLIGNASATYITGDIYLDENGNSRFDLETDIPIQIQDLTYQENALTGTTNQLLSLRGGIWTLELSLEEYDDIFIDIHLPNNLISILSVEGSDSIIDIEEKIVTLADSGKLEFKMSYELKEKRNYSWIYWLAAIAIIVLGFLAYKKFNKRKEKFEHIMPMINEKEQRIIDLLMKKPLRQKELRKALQLPKASFSRYMVNLEKKKLIIREGEGKNKIVRLK